MILNIRRTWQFTCNACGHSTGRFRNADARDAAAVAHGRKCRRAKRGYQIRDESGRVLFRK